MPERSNVSCPACGAVEPLPLWPADDTRFFRIRRCARCHLVYTVPALDAEQMLAYYPEGYYGRRNVRFNRLFERLVTWFRNRRARKIDQLLPPGRVLDVGCGRGHILARLSRRGWETHGVELNEHAAQSAREVPVIRLHVGPFRPDEFPSHYFDVIIFWHVLEHLPEVRAALDGARRLLRPGGLLVVAVPNLASWQARVARYHWFHLDLPRHYSHFTADRLIAELDFAGFDVREICHFSLEQNPYGWIQSTLDALGFRKNLLYDVLKNASARSIQSPMRQYPIQSFCCLLLFAVLLPPALLAMIFESLFRSGPTIEVYAQSRSQPHA